MGKIVYRRILFIIICLVSLFGITGCRQKKVIINRQSELLLKADIWDMKNNMRIDVLKEGAKCKLINIKYTKDFMFYKVKTEDGKIGYILYDNGNVQELGDGVN